MDPADNVQPTETSAPAKRKRKRFGFLKGRRHLPGWLPLLIALFVRLLRATYRVRIVDPAGILASGQPWPLVVLIWHNRILSLPPCVPKQFRVRTAVLISASRDGQYATDYIRHFGFQVVRGSSSRGGFHALRELRAILEAGTSVVLTLDGPRGPRYEAQPGAALLAETCDVAVLPVALNAPSRWEFKSWDRTQLPKPFSRVEFRVGQPVRLAVGPVLANRDQACASLREALLAVTDDGRKGEASAVRG